MQASPPPDPFTAVDDMLAQLDASFPDVTTIPPAQLRAAIRARALPASNLHDVARTEDHDLGDALQLRVYHPHDAARDAPVVLFFHGGGWVFCGIFSHDGFCRKIARETGAIVVSADYRLAPEHPYPAALDDASRALAWITTRFAPAQGVYVMGDSAGGNLAAALSLRQRDAAGPQVAGQILLYPVLDSDLTTESYRRFGSGHYNTTANMRWYWQQYLGRPDIAAPPALAAPLRAPDLAGLPPAIVLVAGRDPTASEGLAYAKALKAAGNTLRVRLYPDLFHGCATMLAFRPADTARDLLWSDMRALIHARKDK